MSMMASSFYETDDDVKITKVVSAKKPMSWVASSFNSFQQDTQPLPNRIQDNSLSNSKCALPSHSSLQPRRTGAGVQTSIKKAFSTDTSTRKRPRDTSTLSQTLFQSSTRLSKTPTFELWSDRYSPKSRGELAVHKKKIEEISDWLQRWSQREKGAKSAPVLLLTGPPGAGKTACIRVLCKEQGYNIQEWTSTSEQAVDQWVAYDNFSHSEHSQVDAYQSQSQSTLFQNFLLRANKYKALELSGTGESQANPASTSAAVHDDGSQTIIVVEELPNVFYREASVFHDIIRRYKRAGKSPLVFIVCESNNNSAGVQKLFPKDLQNQLHVTNISMNPVAPTLLVKLLTRIAKSEAVKVAPPSTTLIEAIAQASSGDIRSALNTLQFACGKDTQDLKTLSVSMPQGRRQGSHKSKKGSFHAGKKTSCDDDLSAASSLGIKDKAVFLFHSVGKILHFKRGNPAEYSTVPALPKHLTHFDRDPLLVNPEDVASKTQVSGDYLTSFLHENYVEFLSTVEDLERAAEYFSDADYMSTLWMAREELQRYTVSVATRGFIHSNSDIVRHDSPRRAHGWLPLHKSSWFSASKQANENILSARQLFKGYHWEPEVLCTEVLPYISLTNPTLHDPGQISFVQEIAQFSKIPPMNRSYKNQLHETDVVVEDEEEGMLSQQSLSKYNHEYTSTGQPLLGSQSSSQAVTENNASDDENVVIEEYDDDDDFGDFVF